MFEQTFKNIDDILHKDAGCSSELDYVENLKNAKELFESYLQSVFTNPGKDWEQKTLDEVADNLDSKRVPITKSARKSGEYPYYGASGIVDYVADYIFDDVGTHEPMQADRFIIRKDQIPRCFQYR